MRVKLGECPAAAARFGPRGRGLLSPTLAPALCPAEPKKEDSARGLPGPPLSGSLWDSPGETAGARGMEGG